MKTINHSFPITQFLKSVTQIIVEKLDTEVLGIYIIGSLAHGGYTQRYSDIDLVFITRNIISDEITKTIIQESKLFHSEYGPKLSIFWSDRTFSSGRFPILDQIDFLDHRVTIFESQKIIPNRPSLEEIRKYLSGHPIEYWKDKTHYFNKTTHLKDEDHKELLRCLIYPARLIYTWSTSKMTSNDESVNHLSTLMLNEHNLKKQSHLDMNLIIHALKVRNAGDPADSLLLYYRDRLHSQFEKTINYLENLNEPTKN